MVTRIIAMDSTREVSHLGRPEYWTSYQTPHGTMITVEGPAWLQATEAGVTLNLRASLIEEAISFSYVPGVRNWFDVVSRDLIGRVGEIRPDAKSYFGGNMVMLIGSVWSQVLSTCVSQRNGGDFVVVNPDNLDGKIRPNYTLNQVNIAEDIVDFWLASIEADYANKRDLELWLRGHNSLWVASRSTIKRKGRA